MHQEHPELVKDQYWEEVFPNEIPYAIPTMRHNPPEASTAYMETQRVKLFWVFNYRLKSFTKMSSFETLETPRIGTFDYK